MNLVPKVKKSKYPIYNAKKNIFGWSLVLCLGITWKEGPGISIGLGLIDIWFGWPRQQDNLCTEKCRHKPFPKTA